LLRWVENFLIGRQLRVKIGQDFSDWLEIWGTVPQGTLLGVLCFVCMINDLSTGCETIKYVDDTTLYNVSSQTDDQALQGALNVALKWSTENDMRLNGAKTKEMLISFSKEPPEVATLFVNDTPVERVNQCTLLGVQLSSNLTWEGHVNKIVKKANVKLFFIRQLKRARVLPGDIVSTFLAVVRPVLEYACQVWHAGLTTEQHNALEKIQERALRIAAPGMSYPEALTHYDIPTLLERRNVLCKRLFTDMKKDTHKLHGLLPPKRERHYSTRCSLTYALPKIRTERYKKSFVPYSLFNLSCLRYPNSLPPYYGLLYLLYVFTGFFLCF